MRERAEFVVKLLYLIFNEVLGYKITQKIMFLGFFHRFNYLKRSTYLMIQLIVTEELKNRKRIKN